MAKHKWQFGLKAVFVVTTIVAILALLWRILPSDRVVWVFVFGQVILWAAIINRARSTERIR
jgi:hypothetical protein